MSVNQGPHPPHDTLTAYGLGKLQPAEAVAVETHIAECEECCETLHDLGNDTFVNLVRQSDARQIDSATGDEKIGRNKTENESACELPDELLHHPRYRVLELLGKGGMGSVYKAEHTLMNRTVALKLINRDLVQNLQAVERFRREVQSAAQLSHSNIVTAHDAEQAGDVHFLVMEYVPGKNLSEVVRQQGPLDVAQACDYIQQVAAGLQHAYAQGMVHCDIKPHNLMVTDYGQVKILDFGLATLVVGAIPNEERERENENDSDPRVSQQLTSADSMMGTPDFISPEQANDARSADIRSDIYSLGCTFYYLLTGGPPFTDASATEKVKAHGEREPERIEKVRAEIPIELADIVRRMMAKDPAKRFQTPAEVADTLVPFVDSYRAEPAERQIKTQAKVAAPSRAWRPPRMLTATALAAFAFIFATILYVTTDGGTFVVESEDDSVEITIHPANGDAKQESDSTTQMRIIDTVTGSTVKRLRSGEYVLSLKGDKNDFQLSQGRFIIKRGGKVVVTVTRKEKDEDVATAPVKQKSELVVRKVWPDAKDNTGGPSPDGRYLAFVDWDTGDVAVRDMQTHKNRRLTNKGSWQESSAFALYPCFSADSKTVAYTWYDKDGNTSLRVVDLEGGDPRVVYVDENDRTPQVYGWMPDGKHVLATLGDVGINDAFELAFVNVADGGARVLKTYPRSYPHLDDSGRGIVASHFELDPKGQFIAYSRLDGSSTTGRDVCLIDAQTGEEQQVTFDRGDEYVLGWMPEGKQLLFASERDDTWDAWLVSIVAGKADGRPKPIRSDIGIVDPMGISRDGTFFYGLSYGGLKVSTVTLDLDSGKGELTPLKSDHLSMTDSSMWPCWSPDGKLLAYKSMSPSRAQQIEIVNMETDAVHSLVLDVHLLGTFDWTADGKSFTALVGEDPGSVAIYRIDSHSGEISVVVPSEKDGMGKVKPSPDGRGVFYLRKNTTIVYWDINEGKARVLNPDDAQQFDDRAYLQCEISPDSSRITAFGLERDSGDTVMQLIDIQSGESSELVRLEKGNIRGWVTWVPDGKSLLYGILNQKTSKAELWHKVIDGGQPRKIEIPGVESLRHMDLHPDGKRLAYTSHTPRKAEVWTMENFVPPISTPEDTTEKSP